jgi:predicted nuclease of restriction endonuclease-like RecB superfamily
VFPVQLMTVRKSKNGVVRSVFLTSENSNYAISVIDLFRQSTGKRRKEIENEIKVLELKSQNPKIVRGLALLMFRLSRMDPPSFLDPMKVRKAIFSFARTPPVAPEERDTLVARVAEEFDVAPDEISRAMYADKEDEQILVSVPDITPDDLSARYNLEQVETVMLKTSSIIITTTMNHARFERRIRSLGLLYRVHEENGIYRIEVSGPMSIIEHSDRYGSRIALLMRYLFHYSDWQVQATVKLKNGDGKSDYTYYLDDAAVELLISHDSTDSLEQNGILSDNPAPIKSAGNIIFPDYSAMINNTPVAVFVTRPSYYEEDRAMVSGLVREGHAAELFCILEKGEKCPPGAHCFRDELDRHAVLDYLKARTGKQDVAAKKPEKQEEKPAHMHQEIPDKVIQHLHSLYPDSQAMVDYLEFMGFDPSEALQKAGFTIKWRGLRLTVEGK